MDARDCRTYQGGMRVQRSEGRDETDKTRPDVVVRCGPGSTRTCITDPVVVVEVPSPSTIDIDRGRKLDFYKSLPRIRHIALVYQEQMRVEHYRRTGDDFEFAALTSPADELAFDAVGFAMSLERVCFGASPRT